MPSVIEALFGGGAAFFAACGWLKASASQRMAEGFERTLQDERAVSHHRWMATLEAMTGAIEASDPFLIGHLECVRRAATAMAKSLSLSPLDTEALLIAGMLHNIGRLGVPENILNKAESLTDEEQERLRIHPALGARIIAPIPFPVDVLPLVRHHAEHWDGTGYPAGLKGGEIPLGARILAVANAYSSLLRARPYRPAMSPADALAEIERKSGSQFDPAVVAAFRSIAAQLREEAEEEAGRAIFQSIDQPASAKAALYDIAAAQREALALQKLSLGMTKSLHREAIAESALQCVMETIAPSGCALFMPDGEEGEYLQCVASNGVNARSLLGSHARIGAYLTGRAFSRSESTCATFHPEDVKLREVSEAWTPFRTTLIAPLQCDGVTYGTLNLYSETPEAFGKDSARVLREIASQCARALSNAARYLEIAETAYTDSLTGLKNGRYLRQFIEQEINRAQRENKSVAILNMDLDNFKPINDQFGHARGDQTLKEVAEILRQHTRSYDLAARYAGDEFVVVLSQSDPIAAEVVATKLKIAVEKHGERLTQREAGFPKLGVSIGVALFPKDGADLQSLLCTSDASMYADKAARKQGRAA